jgi:hypothetical protein
MIYIDAALTCFPVFEEEAGSWEDKLNRIHVLFGMIVGY